MKILFCSNLPLTKELGAPKVLLELAEALRELSWDCTMLGASDLQSEDHPDAARTIEGYSQALRAYLLRHADEHDVVDYEHAFLPYPRREFATRPLFVARSVLMAHHLQMISIPVLPSLRSKVGNVVRARARKFERDDTVERATITIREADFVNVSNDDDKSELLRRGVDPAKIAVIPFGISSSRRPLFEAVASAPPDGAHIIAFVGTFDPRKGAVEFPDIVRRVIAQVPTARFRLLGTRGLFPTQQAVLERFPLALRQHLEVTPQFRPEALPELLASCSVGIFPSYMEGFPFSVLEMLAASLPVVAYDAPGAPMMLPPEYLVSRGDARGMAAKIIELLRDRNRLAQARIWAKARSHDFTWERAAQLTAAAYTAAFGRRQEQVQRSVTVGHS